MVEREKIGVGVVTCNREDYALDLIKSLNSISKRYDEIVLVNDGAPIEVGFPDISLIQNETNLGVGISKNKAIEYLLSKNCEYIFILEDDVIIKDESVFDRYITACRESGIQHFNFGPGTPFNRIQTIQNFDLHNRHDLEEDSKPNPVLTIMYAMDIGVDLYLHVAGVFSFFTRRILNEVGLHDERFFNAWEHVDHTMRIIKQEAHPPFWWFADICNSNLYLDVRKDAIDRSSTSNNKEEWYRNIVAGREIYREKHGFYPNMCPHTSKENAINSLKAIKNKWKI